jgi:hypothetical protein
VGVVCESIRGKYVLKIDTRNVGFNLCVSRTFVAASVVLCWLQFEVLVLRLN